MSFRKEKKASSKPNSPNRQIMTISNQKRGDGQSTTRNYNSEVEEIKEVAESGSSKSETDSNKSSIQKCRESQGTIGENLFKLNIKQDLTLTANPFTDNRGFNSII